MSAISRHGRRWTPANLPSTREHGGHPFPDAVVGKRSVDARRAGLDTVGAVTAQGRQGSGPPAHELERDGRRSLGEGLRRLRADPAVPILVLTTLVHIVRRSPLDIIVFGGTALLIIIDRSTPLLGPLVRNRWIGELEGRWLDVSAIVFGLLIGSLQHGSWPVLLALVVPGVFAAVVVLRARPSGEISDAPPTRAPPGSRIWVALLIVAALWELSSFVQQPGPTTDSHNHPVLSTLIDPLLASPWHRAIAIAVWFAIGGRLLRMVVADAVSDEPDTVGRVQPHLHQGDA
jgi:hypothetical protein